MLLSRKCTVLVAIRNKITFDEYDVGKKSNFISVSVIKLLHLAGGFIDCKNVLRSTLIQMLRSKKGVDNSNYSYKMFCHLLIQISYKYENTLRNINKRDTSGC